MKKISLTFSFLFLFLFTSAFVGAAFAGGGITHMYIAQKAMRAIPDNHLRNLLLDNIDAYLAGAYYPDSGYVKGASYGEDSHWDPFIYTFADYLKEEYPDPSIQNPKLVAFLLGCAAHRVSDEIIHWTFYRASAKEDFKGDWEGAHQNGDVGIDAFLNIDQDQWLSNPTTWWVPVKDLLQVYHRMGKDQYKAEEIIWGNSAIFVAGFGERFVSPPLYLYYKWEMPWTYAHYTDWPAGGILADTQKVVEYQMNLWSRLQNGSTPLLTVTHPKNTTDNINSASLHFAENALASKAVTVSVQKQSDGSVVLEEPVISKINQFRTLLNQWITAITK